MEYYIMKMGIFYIMEHGIKVNMMDMELNIIKMEILIIKGLGQKVNIMVMEYYMMVII